MAKLARIKMIFTNILGYNNEVAVEIHDDDQPEEIQSVTDGMVDAILIEEGLIEHTRNGLPS